MVDPNGLGLTAMPEEAPQEAPAFQMPENISEENPLTLVNPVTKKSFDVYDTRTASALLDNGWNPETKEELLKRYVEDDVAQHPIRSAVEAVSGQLVNQLGLGVPRLLDENLRGEGNLEQKLHNAAVEEQHPYLNFFGGAVGIGDALILSGGTSLIPKFGEAALKTAADAAIVSGESVAKKAAYAMGKAATDNVILNMPYRISESILGDPNKTGEGLLAHAAEDFGVGAAFGLGTSLVGPIIKKSAGLASKAITPESLEEASNYFQFKNAGALTSEFKKLEKLTGQKTRPAQIQTVTDVIDEHADWLTQAMGSSAIYKKLTNAKLDIGRRLTGLRAIADNEMPMGAIPFKSVDDGLLQLEKEYRAGTIEIGKNPLSNLDTMKETYGNRPGQWPTANGITQGVEDISSQKDLGAIDFIRNQLRSAAARKMEAMGIGKEEQARRLASGDIPNFTLEDMHEFRQREKTALFKSDQSYGGYTDGGTDAWNVVGNVMDDAVDRTVNATANPELKSIFKQTNKAYSKLTTVIHDIIEPAANRADARNKVGLGAMVSALGGAGQFAAAITKQMFGNYAMYKSLGIASKVLDKTSGDVTKAIGNILTSEPAEKGLMGSVNVWSRYTGKKDTTPEEGFKALQNDLNLAQSDPQNISRSLQSMTPSLDQFAPQNYALMGATAQNAMKYLKDVTPKPPDPMYPGGPSRPWMPSDNELSKYSRKFNAVLDPTSILRELKSGTLTRESIEAVSTVYPNFYSAIQTEIMKSLATAPPGQVYALRQKLALILPKTEDPMVRAQRIQGLQAGFAPNNNHVKPRANSKIDESGRYETPLNRISHE